MRVKITVAAWADIPDNANVTAFAMSLQDSWTVLDEYVNMEGYEVIVYSAPPPRTEDTKI